MLNDRLIHLATGVMSALLLTGVEALADDYQIVSFSAEVSASASAYDYTNGDSDSDQNDDQTVSFDDLPLLVSASASTNMGGGSGSGQVNGSVDASSLTVTGGGEGNGFGSGFDGDGSGDGSGGFTLAFTVEQTLVARIELYAIGDGSGNIGIGSASFSAGGKLVESVDSDGNFYDERIFEYTLVPDVLYEISGYGGGGGGGGIGGGSEAYGDGSVTITTLCAIDGELSIGTNAFDTTTAVGTQCDLTGACDPGDFGDDVIYAARYFHFTASETTDHTFSTCNSADFDTRLAILADGCDPASVIACLDDTVGCAGFTTSLTATLEAGTRYTIVVGGYNANNFGAGTLDISAVAIAFEVTDLGGSVEAMANADFFGCNNQPPQSDSENLAENPTSMDELPISLTANASTCCSNGIGAASLNGSEGLNVFSATAQSAAGGCADSNNCVSSSGSGMVDITFALDVLVYSEATIDWALFGDFGGASGITLRDTEGNIVLSESHGFPLNEGSTTLNLIAGVYRLGVTTAANATGYCAGPEPIGSAQVDVTMIALGDPSDINGDGIVDGIDLALVLGNWGPCPGCPADINGDGIVDGIDLAVVLGGWSG